MYISHNFLFDNSINAHSKSNILNVLIIAVRTMPIIYVRNVF